MDLYRITHTRWSGSLIASGRAARWNSNNVFVIYSSFTRSLACLENLVHYSGIDLSASFSIVIIDVPDDLPVKELPVSTLPSGWHLSDPETYNRCRKFGDEWYKRNDSLLLKVPSAIIKDEFNCLINTVHPDFIRLRRKAAEPFFFDQRIKAR
jgi:RES domain-containing protein